MIFKGARRKLTWTALAALLPSLAACGVGEADSRPSPRKEAGRQGSLGNPRVLNCANRNVEVPGEEDGIAVGPDDLAVGPLVIPGLLAWGGARAEQYGNNHRFKVGAMVRKGGTVTLSIPAKFHGNAGLLYAEPARNARTPAEADHAVTFTACAGHDTVFVGGFFVKEPRCVLLEFSVPGKATVQREISFFNGKC